MNKTHTLLLPKDSCLGASGVRSSIGWDTFPYAFGALAGEDAVLTVAKRTHANPSAGTIPRETPRDAV